MISAELLIKVIERLQQITSNLKDIFKGLDVIFIDDLRQLLKQPQFSKHQNKIFLGDYGMNSSFINWTRS